MTVLATRLKQGTPHSNKVTLMGKVLDTPRIRRDMFGDIAIIYLHIPEHETGRTDCMDDPFPQPPSAPLSSCILPHGHGHASIPVRVRGQVAQWCSTHIQTGMLLLVDAHLSSLGITETDACLTHIEAEQLQLIGEPHYADMVMLPDAPPHFGAMLHAHQYSMSTN